MAQNKAPKRPRRDVRTTMLEIAGSEAVSASSWRAAEAASRLTPPTITASDCFRARVRPLLRSPWRARGSTKTPPGQTRSQSTVPQC